MKNSVVNKYYAPTTRNNTLIERQIKRLKHDPIRYYEGANEKVSNISVKGVRLA